MKRRLFNFVTALSLLLLVAAGVLWVRSYFYWDQVVVTTPRQLWMVGLRQGGVVTNVFRYRAANHEWGVRREGPFRGRQGLNVSDPTFWNRLGLLATHRPRHNGSETVAAVPYWAACVVLALLPALRLRRRLVRLAAVRRGRCAECGYDLAGNVSGVCPECGTRASRTPA